MKQITKDHIVKAIQEIDNEGVRPGRNSSTYDLIFNDKPYPPKLVVSLANKYATGEELDHNTFAGGQGTPAFNLLHREGFVIKNKIEIANSNITRFYQAIDEFIKYLTVSDSIISAFSFGNYTSRSKWVWISDQLGIIGDINCHYELIQRKTTDGNIGISVEIHFEDQSKKDYLSLLKDNLPTDVYWNDRHKPNLSLAYKDIISYSDPELLIKLETALVYLEVELGSRIRKIKHIMNSVNFKEDFINWFIARDGIDNSYFTLQFGSNIERFRNEMNKYEEIYKNDFDEELFLINPSNLKDKIEEIDKNIYSNSEGFSEYSQGNNHGRPKAILGKNNYIKFLNEYSFKNNISITETEIKNIPLNQILYGPPGTGKTYNTINKAIGIINPSFNTVEDREMIKEEYDRLVKEGQIVFTTFHQSTSYEDFIEGIKPETKNNRVIYSVKEGVFKSIVKKALSEYIKSEEVMAPEKDDFDMLFDSFCNSIKPLEGKRQGTFTTKTGIEMMLVEANNRSILVKYLWDNNKTKDTEAHHVFTVSKDKLKKVLLEGIDPSKVKSLLAELHPIIGHIHCELFAVYKSFYEFIMTSRGEIDTVHFSCEDQSFAEVQEQFNTLDHDTIKNKIVKPYVLIIDEINRGNISQIFGELITLIEESKRLGKDESLEVKLTYSKEQFGVPSNLYIIGTMNTADRSVEALDTALRRRFCFEEMLPKTSLLKNKNVDEIELEELLSAINKRIEVLLDRDHTIGHSYFINVTNQEELRNTFKNNIIPLLQEYFYGDYEKIGMILGTGFFDAVENFDHSLFAKFQTQNYPEAGSFIRLKTIDDEFNIIDAIKILMNKEVANE